MHHHSLLLATAALLLVPALPSSADVKLPNLFSSHMVMQRDAEQRVWGTADPDERITVRFDNHQTTALTGADGTWLATLPPLEADGKKHTLTVRGNNEIVLEDILVGDVWIGSGQSNMEWKLSSTDRGKEFIAAADHPDIRLFHIPKVQKPEPASDVDATWKTCTPENIPNFSAVLYHFGRHIHGDQKIPVGLINSSWGGSPIEPWTVTGEGSGKMYNGMIAPIIQFPVTGTIWYQGETNVIRKNGLAYGDKMKDLIEGWRRVFDNETMPFYFVQIAPWGNERYATGELPALWQAQCATLNLPHTGMAVTTDIVHDIGDIHPRNKHDVGDRLARWALAKHYGNKDLVYSGPLYKAMKVEGDRIRLAFAHAGGLKTRDGEAPNEFKIAAADGEFVDAEAKIDGDHVIVSAASITTPTQVRFGWHRTANPNLVNAAGLPASPFQTKNWTGGTSE